MEKVATLEGALDIAEGNLSGAELILLHIATDDCPDGKLEAIQRYHSHIEGNGEGDGKPLMLMGMPKQEEKVLAGVDHASNERLAQLLKRQEEVTAALRRVFKNPVFGLVTPKKESTTA